MPALLMGRLPDCRFKFKANSVDGLNLFVREKYSDIVYDFQGKHLDAAISLINGENLGFNMFL